MYSAKNDIFCGQSSWFLILRTNKNVLRDKGLNVPATLDITPRKITKHKSEHHWSVFGMNQIKIISFN